MLRLAMAGSKADGLRFLLTAVSTALTSLIAFATAAVLSIHSVPHGVMLDDGRFLDLDTSTALHGVWLPYTSTLLNDPGQRQRVVFVLLLLAVPVLIFTGQCSRIGAPARDRRLAGLRLAGATPRQVIAVAATETALAGVAGAAGGAALYAALRVLADRPDQHGVRPLPTDVVPSWWWFIAIATSLPLLAALSSAILMRRVTVGPLGVARQCRTRGPRPWPGVLIGLAFVAFTAAEAAHRYYERQAQLTHTENAGDQVVGALIVGGSLCACVGVVLGTGWITHTTGRLLDRFARRPAPVLAGARMMNDPWSGSRAWAAMLAGVTLAAGTAAAYAYQQMQARRQETHGRQMAAAQGEPYVPADWVHHAERQLQLLSYAAAAVVAISAGSLLVNLAEAIVTRRRINASLVAAGTPRSSLAWSVVWQTITPLLPATLLATAVGVLLPLRLFDYQLIDSPITWDGCAVAPADPPLACDDPVYAAAHTQTVHTGGSITNLELPWHLLAFIVAGTIIAVLAITALALAFLRASLRPSELRTT